MDAKTIQQLLAAQRRDDAKTDPDLASLIQRGAERAAKFKANWQSLDLDEFLSRFAPNPVHVVKRGKIYYQSRGSDLIVVVDVGGWYCRLYDVRRDLYLGKDGTNVHNYVTERGTIAGRSHKDWLAATHFRIKKKGE